MQARPSKHLQKQPNVKYKHGEYDRESPNAKVCFDQSPDADRQHDEYDQERQKTPGSFLVRGTQQKQAIAMQNTYCL